jgi:hypothetical protein
MSDASDLLKKWVRKNITLTTAHIDNDTLTAGRPSRTIAFWWPNVAFGA